MKKVILAWAAPLSALFVFGPLAGWLTGSLRAPDGGPDTSVIVCEDPARGILALLGAAVIALIAGTLAGRLVNARYGFSTAGLTLAWATWKLGTVDVIIRRVGGPAPLWTMAAEGVLVGALGLIIGAAVWTSARRESAELPLDHRGGIAAGSVDTLKAILCPRTVVLPLLAYLVVCCAGVWLIALEPYKGQAVLAVVIGSLAGAAAGRLVSYQVNPIVFVLGASILAIVGPVAGAVVHGDQVAATVNEGGLLPIAVPMPLDWMAGVFIGVPVGLSWAGSMIEKHGRKAE